MTDHVYRLIPCKAYSLFGPCKNVARITADIDIDIDIVINIVINIVIVIYRSCLHHGPYGPLLYPSNHLYSRTPTKLASRRS